MRYTSAFRSCLFGLSLLVATVPALSHHSFAMYDAGKIVTIKGTVKSFQWTNPHVMLWLNVERQGAEPQLWYAEVSSPGSMTREGWSRRSIKPGDAVSVEIAPLRDGKPGGSLKKVTIAATGVVLVHTPRTECRPGLE